MNPFQSVAMNDDANSPTRPDPMATSDQMPADTIREDIGPYKLLQKIGEGGMGTVYMAQQEKPVRRRVALKIIKPGMDSKQVVARFEAERQALSMMDHPNIAHVLDVGTTELGRPYFVMELVKGLPIIRYCEDNRVPLRDRLGLFKSVCNAVQHAHQKGIIHRDLKPSNILVAEYDHESLPKIIDFGLAKALHQQLTDKTMFTQFGQVVGTLEYMSPEQSKMNELDVDTRTDIYSLGVILYELLTGTTPFEKERLRAAAFDEVLRIIREEDPPRPSARLSTIESLPRASLQSRPDARSRSSLVRGELDWIVMKAMDKDRVRRYESANGLAMDVQRYLDDESVRACPPSAGYKLRKFARRNKIALVSGCLVFATLLIGIVGMTLLAFRATEQRDRALRAEEKSRTEAAISNAVNAFLNEDLLAQASPANQPDRDITLRTVLDLAAEKIEGRFEQQPIVEAAIRETIGDAYYGLGVYEQCEWQFRMRHAILERELGPANAEALASLYKLAKALDRQDEFAESEQIHRNALQVYDQHFPPEHLGRLNNLNGLANALWNRGKIAESTEIYHEIADIAKVEYPTSDRTMVFRLNEAWGVEYLGRYADAERQYQDTLDFASTLDNIENQMLYSLRQGIARAQWRQGKLDVAEQGFREVLELQISILGGDHPETLQSWTGLADVLIQKGDFDAADEMLTRVLKVQPKAIGPDNFYTLQTYMAHAGALFGNGQYELSEQQFRKVLATIERRQFNAEYLDAQLAMNGIAAALVAQKKFNEAEEFYRDLLAAQQRFFGSEHRDTKTTLQNLENVIDRQRDNGENGD